MPGVQPTNAAPPVLAHCNQRYSTAPLGKNAIWNVFAGIGLTPSTLRAAGRGMAAVEQTIRYRRELVAGDVVAVRSRITVVVERNLR